MVYVGHDAAELVVDLLGSPRNLLAVLGHFETADGHTACVGSLTWGVEDARSLELADSFGGAGHVGAFAHGYAAVGKERTCVVAVDLVLSSRGHGDVGFDVMPGTLAGIVFAPVFFSELAYAAAVYVLELEDVLELLVCEAFGNHYRAVAVAHGNDLGAEFHKLHGSICGHIAAARDGYLLALDVDALGGEHIEQEVAVAETGSFGTNQRTAEFAALAGECAGEFAGHLLVPAVHIADFTSAHAYVACRHVGVGAYLAPELGDECLAETHNLHVALAAWREVGAALCATHCKGGQRVLEGLLEGKELEDGGVDGAVETNASLVGADGIVVLDAIAHIVAHLTLVIDPGNTEAEDAIGNAESLYQVVALEFGVLVVGVLDGGQNLFNCLDVFRLVGEAATEVVDYIFCFHLFLPLEIIPVGIRVLLMLVVYRIC